MSVACSPVDLLSYLLLLRQPNNDNGANATSKANIVSRLLLLFFVFQCPAPLVKQSRFLREMFHKRNRNEIYVYPLATEPSYQYRLEKWHV